MLVLVIEGIKKMVKIAMIMTNVILGHTTVIFMLIAPMSVVVSVVIVDLVTKVMVFNVSISMNVFKIRMTVTQMESVVILRVPLNANVIMDMMELGMVPLVAKTLTNVIPPMSLPPQRLLLIVVTIV